jgi:paraquat-inducible protein A
LNERFLSTTVACPDCDLLQHLSPLEPGGRLQCVRCGSQLAKRPVGPEGLCLALTVATAIVFVLANTSPLMDLSAVGRVSSTTIAGGALEMWRENEQLTAILVAICAVIAPGAYLLYMLVLLIAARLSPVPRWVGGMLRSVHHFATWSMLEVMLLGILVALIKIAAVASVDVGIGMFAVGALVLLFPALIVTFDEREVWQRMEWYDGEMPELAVAEALAAKARKLARQ